MVLSRAGRAFFSIQHSSLTVVLLVIAVALAIVLISKLSDNLTLGVGQCFSEYFCGVGTV
jgi:hypothetical protein